jgi:hypothetical protein
MSHKDNMDLRNTGDGGWFYAEHELFSVFVPLIGPDGGMVYMAMCRLIPLAAVDPDRPVTVRSTSAASGVSRSTTDRKMKEIVALGMVEETRFANRRPSTYKLVSLRGLALVGIAELRERLGVPPGDTEKAGSVGYATEKEVSPAAKTASQSVDASKAKLGGTTQKAKAPAASGESGVPRWDTDRDMRKTTLVDLLVSQKTPLVSQKQASVSQNGGSLFKEEKEEEQYSPLPPSQAKGVKLDFVAASADPKTSKSKSFAERRDERLAAVAKVMRECDLSASRLGPVFEQAMRTEASKTDAPPDWNAIAERMAKSYSTWLANLHLMAFKPGARKFFTELWTDQRKWPWDEKRIREMQRAKVGS